MNTEIFGTCAPMCILKYGVQVSMKTKFHLHSYVNIQGESQIIMGISASGKRERIPLGVYVKPIHWDKKSQTVKKGNPNYIKINLLLDKERSRINEIKIHYHIIDKPLSLEKLVEEYKNTTPSYDFIAFMRSQLDKMPMKDTSRMKHKSQINKLQEYKEKVPFRSIDIEFIENFKSFLAIEKGNNKNTIASCIKIIKKFIRKAKKYGIPIDIDLDEIKIGAIKGNRTYLSSNEVRKLKEYFYSSFIRDSHKLTLGYFLFSCYTGLRISEVKSLRRHNFTDKTYTFISEKTGKQQTMLLNNSARDIINSYPDLFKEFISDQRMNDFLKEIMTVVGIKKHVSFHVSRHTFATNFLLAGGKVEELQVLLGHSNINTTMIYVHLAKSEQIDSVFLLDD